MSRWIYLRKGKDVPRLDKFLHLPTIMSLWDDLRMCSTSWGMCFTSWGDLLFCEKGGRDLPPPASSVSSTLPHLGVCDVRFTSWDVWARSSTSESMWSNIMGLCFSCAGESIYLMKLFCSKGVSTCESFHHLIMCFIQKLKFSNHKTHILLMLGWFCFNLLFFEQNAGHKPYEKQPQAKVKLLNTHVGVLQEA